MERDPIDRVAESFRGFAPHTHGSPLYAELSQRIAEDPEVLAVASRIEHGPRQNILFAAVQYLLSPDDPLASVYASFEDPPRPPEEAYTEFRRFVIAHAGEIEELGRTRYVQTNEPRRCAVLLPALAAAARVLGEPLHLVDLGASAGLNLAFDRYYYEYGERGRVGEPESPLTLSCDPRGPVPIPGGLFAVSSRTGLDLHPLDLDDPDQVGWLRALIWPEHRERRWRLEVAAQIAAGVPKRLIAGDAATTLPEVLEQLPPGEPVLVMHSFAWNQIPDESREGILATLRREVERRRVAKVGLEYWERGLAWPELEVTLFPASPVRMGRGHPHGEWVEWGSGR